MEINIQPKNQPSKIILKVLNFFKIALIILTLPSTNAATIIGDINPIEFPIPLASPVIVPA